MTALEMYFEVEGNLLGQTGIQCHHGDVRRGSYSATVCTEFMFLQYPAFLSKLFLYCLLRNLIHSLY